MEKVAAEEKRMEESADVPGVGEPVADMGRKIVFENFDFKHNVHHMTETKPNIDNHRFSHMSTENRVSGNNFSTVRPEETIQHR